MNQAARMHASFVLVALTIAFPPLISFTAPLLALAWLSGRSAKQRAQAQAQRIAEQRADRARVLAFRSLP